MNTLKLSIATPNGEVYNENNITMVTMETHSGSIGVMAKHEPMVTTLKIGVLKIVNDKKETTYFAVSEGFVECHGTEVSVIVQTAEESSTIDKSRAESAKERAENRLSNVTANTDVRRAEIALAKAIARIKVAEIK